MADILFSAFRGGKERKYCQDLWSRPLLPYLSSAFSHIFLFTLMNTPPPPPLLLLLVEKPLLWRMSWPLPIEVVGRWLLEGLWSQISASPPVYPEAAAPPRISNFFLSKYWQPPVVLYNIEVERLLPQQSLLTLSFGAKCQSFFLCDSTFLLASYCPFSSVQLQVHWGPKHFWRTKLRFVGRFFLRSSPFPSLLLCEAAAILKSRLSLWGTFQRPAWVLAGQPSPTDNKKNLSQCRSQLLQKVGTILRNAANLRIDINCCLLYSVKAARWHCGQCCRDIRPRPRKREKVPSPFRGGREREPLCSSRKVFSLQLVSSWISCQWTSEAAAPWMGGFSKRQDQDLDLA